MKPPQRALVQHRDPQSGQCVDVLNRILLNDDKVQASVLATFNAPLTIWANPVVGAAMSANDFDPRDLRRRRIEKALSAAYLRLSSVYIGGCLDPSAWASPGTLNM